MRVIAGTWKGRRLEAPRGLAVRPTTDRLKEAMFNILGPYVGGGRVVDLCCGTGSLGIEALSRGADEVVFVDTAKSSLVATEQNLSRCKAASGTYQLVKSDAVVFLGRELAGKSAKPLVVVCDPPYAADLAGRVLELMTQWRSRPNFAAAAVEMGAHSSLPLSVDDGWELRRYGSAMLAVMRRETLGDGDD